MGVAIAKGILKTLGIEYKAETIYRVQVGAYESEANAKAVQKKLKANGYSTIITKS